MKFKHLISLPLLVAGVAVSVIGFRVFAGHPVWPPHKHSAGSRQANMLFLRFQDALAAEQWSEALSLCGDRVRAKAAEWPSPEVFFKDTIPIDLLLAQSFGCWRCSDKFYGLLVPLTEPESKPFIQWYWAIAATNEGWVVDYPPMKLDEYVVRKKAAIQQREQKTEAIRAGLEPKLKDVRIDLVPVSEQFIIGSPMLFRLELVNLGPTAVDFMNSGVAHYPLTVLDRQGQPLPFTPKLVQTMVRAQQVAPGASAVVADRIDLGKNYAITNPGQYEVQFSGERLVIGQPVPSWEPGPFGEAENEAGHAGGFFSLTNRLPSAPVKIKVRAGRRGPA